MAVDERVTERVADPAGPLLVRVEEAAARLAIGRSKLYELIARGEIGTVTIGAARRVPVDELERYVRERIRRGR